MCGVVWCGVCIYVAYMHVHVGTLISLRGGLSVKPQEHPADINRKEYWAGHRISTSANEPGSEVV